MRDDRTIKKNNRIDSEKQTYRNDDFWVSLISKRKLESNRTSKYIQRPSHSNRRRK